MLGSLSVNLWLPEMRSLLGLIALTLLALVTPAPTGAASQRYSVEPIPPIETRDGTFDVIAPFLLNDRGVVVGIGASFERVDHRLFHYHGGRTTEIVTDDDQPIPRALNRRGVVVAQVDRRLVKIRTPSGPLEPLVGGLSDEEVGSLNFGGAGSKGRVVAFSNPLPARPYLYKGRGGWRLLTSDHPAFASEHLEPIAINRAGRVLILSLAGGGSVEGALLRRPNGDVEVVRSEEGETITGIELNDRGAVAGTVVRGAENLAFYYDSRDGFREIVAPGQTRSAFHDLLDDGTALIGSDRGRAVFTFHPARGLSRLWAASDLLAFAESVGCVQPEKAHFIRLSMNQRRDIVGLFGCVGAPGPVHFSEGTGFTFIRDQLTALGTRVRRPEPVALNERGQILLIFWAGEDPDAKSAGVLLSPID